MLFCILKKNDLSKSLFVEICYHTKFHGPAICGTSIAPTLEVFTAVMLVLLMVGNYRGGVGHDVHTKVHHFIKKLLGAG
jgi:hypothetical protein